MDSDAVREGLIEVVKPKLINLIKAEQVVDFIHFLTPEQKEQILGAGRGFACARRLITEVLRKPHTLGWFRTFLDALVQAECTKAAQYLDEAQMVSAETEAEDEQYSKLLQLLYPSIVDKIDVDNVCNHCYSAKIISEADMEEVRCTQIVPFNLCPHS